MGDFSHTNTIPKLAKSMIPMADASSWYCAVVLVTIILLLAGSGSDQTQNYYNNNNQQQQPESGYRVAEGHQLREPCDDIYVVGEGETLHTISDKCGDPFIIDHNPHIHDPDDVFPGLVIKITPYPTGIN